MKFINIMFCAETKLQFALQREDWLRWIASFVFVESELKLSLELQSTG